MNDSAIFRVAMLLIGLLFAAARGEEPAMLPGFHRAAEFEEQEKWTGLDTGGLVYINAPLSLERSNRRLVIYATPNGNTIEQTLGCAMAEGRDWHIDIQHVAAQIRRLREVSADEDVVLAVVQAPKLNWPAFRQAEKEAGEHIRELIEWLSGNVKASRIVLSGHSGGGSFIFGYLNAVKEVPESIERIIFLDANYSYSDDEKHGDKLLAWLHGESSRRLVVIAYDDREITLGGKRVVGPTGGTFRASQRMLDRFGKDVSFSNESHGPFVNRRGLERQIEFFIHPNPDNKILHTALVGEMNGLLHGLTLVSAPELTWGQFGGPRAYAKWIQAEPSQMNEVFFKRQRKTSAKPALFPALNLPLRPANSSTGSQFLAQIESLSRSDREAAVLKEIAQGNIPDFLRSLELIYAEATDSQGTKHTAIYFVTPDYLAIGTNDDFFRIPMTPMTAQAIATAADASLITAKISDDIFRQAELRLEPKPLTKERETAKTFYEHHQLIEEQRGDKPLGLLIAGIKKDVVVTNRLNEKPHRVGIYGWHQQTATNGRGFGEGKPIQPLYVGHVDWYVDYSHGIRLMSQRMIVDGQPRRVEEVLKDKELSVLLSSEGPIDVQY